jgi:hypothetical protein
MIESDSAGSHRIEVRGGEVLARVSDYVYSSDPIRRDAPPRTIVSDMDNDNFR